jgi:hypothetical protein
VTPVAPKPVTPVKVTKPAPKSVTPARRTTPAAALRPAKATPAAKSPVSTVAAKAAPKRATVVLPTAPVFSVKKIASRRPSEILA